MFAVHENDVPALACIARVAIELQDRLLCANSVIELF